MSSTDVRFGKTGRVRNKCSDESAEEPHGIRLLLFAGRLYQARTVAVSMERPYTNDQDLLIRAYRKWGMTFPTHIQGEYAFALWDHYAGRVVLGRDPGGHYPLYYLHRGDNLYFADRIKAILDRSGLDARINEQRLAHWIALHPAFTDQTFFENIHSIRPGTILVYEDGRVALHDLWRPEDSPVLRLRDSREYADGLIDILERVVNERLTGQEGIAASQLSGGLDSSTITSIAAGLLARQGRTLHAFTAIPSHSVDIQNRFTDEGSHAAAVAAMIPNIEHHTVQHGQYLYFSLIDLYGSAQEEPLFNPMNYDWAHGIHVRAAKIGAGCVLDGNSGNFTFSYAGNRVLYTLARKRRFLSLARMACAMHRNESRRWISMAHELVRPLLPMQIRLRLDHRRGVFSETLDYSYICREFCKRFELSGMTNEAYHVRLNDRDLRVLFLRRPDIGAGARAFREVTGVGFSDPAGDPRVVEYCLSIPEEFYCEQGVPRSLIRNAMKGRLPEVVRTERRKGLQAADLGIHFRKEWPEALMELARMKRCDLAGRALDLRRMEEEMQWSDGRIQESGYIAYWTKLMRAFSVGRFLRRFEDGTLFTPPPRKTEEGV